MKALYILTTWFIDLLFCFQNITAKLLFEDDRMYSETRVLN